MPSKDPRADAYIKNAAAFAQPILKHLRKVVHSACPQCEETIKWGFVSFEYKGMFAQMVAFKRHAAFGFWKHSLVVGGARPADAMGSLGRLTSLADLPSDATLVAYIKRAMQLNDAGIRIVRPPKPASKKPLAAPPYLLAALKKNKKAQATFDSFTPGKRKDYIEWLTEAKTAETRDRRLATAIEWLSQGKPRNWKYMTARA